MFLTALSPSTAIVTAYETNAQHDPNNNNAMLGVHASASAIIQYGKIGRKQVRILAFIEIFEDANLHSSCFYKVGSCYLLSVKLQLSPFFQGLVNVALDILSRIHTIPTVPIVDCFQKIRQQVKCYLQLAGVMGKNECMQVRFVIFICTHLINWKLSQLQHNCKFWKTILWPDTSQFLLKMINLM